MNAAVTQRSMVAGGDAILTPDLFCELDTLCKRLTARPLRVYARTEIPLFARCNFMASAVCLDVQSLRTSAPAWHEVGLLEVAAEIRIADWNRARRPEIDLSSVPAERIHEFAVLHETGHRLDNYSAHEAQFRRADDWPEIWQVNEVLADRFAWATMFPGVAIPVRKGCEGVAAWVGDWNAKLADFPRSGRRAIGAQDIGRMLASVPIEHLRRRIPYARRLGPVADGLEQARRDYRNMKRRKARAWQRA